MKVSIIMATFNRSDLIGKAIESVINQTYQDWELIIIDDASNDNTEEVVKSFNDPRIKYQKLLYHVYYTVARNRGIKEATGELLAFHDDDIIWTPRFLEEMVKRFSAPDVVLAHCGRISYSGYPLSTLDVKSIDKLKPTIIHPLIPWSGKESLADKIDVNELMIRRTVFKGSFQGFREEKDQNSYCSDAKLVDDILANNRQGKIVLVPYRGNHYFYNHDSKLNPNMTLQKIKLREEGNYDNHLESKWNW